MAPKESAKMTDQRMPRTDAWRHQYRVDGYARHLSYVELHQRLHDVLLSLVNVTPDGIGFNPSDIGPEEISNESTIWIEKSTHVLEEFKLRYGPYPAGIEGTVALPSKIPEFASELAKKRPDG